MTGSEELLLRLLLAAALGGAVGIERERRSAWAAGLRTHMLVCVGAALFMITSMIGFSDVIGGDHVTLDPSRVAAQVASGIGFLGAGTIILRRKIVHGLTTAASIWTVAAVGLATGGGLYLPAAGATAIVIVILAGVKPLERRLFRQAKLQTLGLLVSDWDTVIPQLPGACEKSGLVLQSLKVDAEPGKDAAKITLTVAGSLPHIAALMQSLRADGRVRALSATIDQP
jgi:putative Mg2+ transporter-C (MgtC) family protein